MNEAITQIAHLLAGMLTGRWVRNPAFGTTKKGTPASRACFPATAQAGEFAVARKRDGSIGLFLLEEQTHWVTQNGERMGAWEVTEYDFFTLTPIAKTTGTGTQVTEA